MVVDAAALASIERTVAAHTAAVVPPLARLDRRVEPRAVALGGGQVVLLGPGRYVNRGLALGLEVEVMTEHLEELEDLSHSVGVPPEVEVSPRAHPTLLERTTSRAYVPVGFRSTLLHPLRTGVPERTHVVAVTEVDDEDGLGEWQETAAAGFGCTTENGRRISDLHVAALASLPTTRLYLARRAGRTVGVASLAVCDGVGILGGMTTLPFARCLGVQGDLIRFRLAAAGEAGCHVAYVTAAPGGVAERNLLRSGFRIAFTMLTVRRPPRP